MIYLAVKRGWSDKEVKTLFNHSILQQTSKLVYFDHASEIPQDYIPLGYIDWVIEALGFLPKPDCYPEFMREYFGRNIWEATAWPMTPGIFIKPSDKPKRFEARITTGSYKGKKKPPYWCSEKVRFINEWRNYVVNGKIIYTGWYTGINDEEIQPEFNPPIPDNWCGLLDMGVTDDGRFLLVEAGEPYSCGWYGTYSEAPIYFDFIVEGWKYLTNIRSNS